MCSILKLWMQVFNFSGVWFYSFCISYFFVNTFASEY